MEIGQEIEIIYEDNHLLVALKPPGVLSQADGSNRPDMLSLLKDYLKQRYSKPGRVYLGLVHRLDMPVGGVMVFARTSKAAARISQQIREHKMDKYYLAVTRGKPEPESGVLLNYLRKDKQTGSVRTTAAADGQKAWLRYVRLAYDQRLDCSLTAVKLGSGRAHQIRVQMAENSWPLLGDSRYGPERETDIDGIGLFAFGLGLNHPVSRAYMLFTAPLPDEKPWNCFTCPSLTDLTLLFADGPDNR